MNKPKILAIAPYEGLKELMESLAAKRTDFSLNVFTGDLSGGAELAGQIQDKGFDLIISRGGTAHMIRKISHIPVIEIEISGYDMLRAFRLAQNYQGCFAIVGFPNITNCAHLLSDLLQYHVDIFTINNSAEADLCLEELYRQNYTMVVGDVVTTELAKQRGLNSILITSGAESILAAFDQAVNLYHTIYRQYKNYRIFKQMAALNPSYIACYDADQQLLFQNNSLSPQFPKQQLDSYLVKQIPSLKVCRKAVLTKHFSDKMCQVYAFFEDSPSPGTAIFFVRLFSAAPHCADSWITIKNFSEGAARAFHTFYTNSPLMKKAADEAMHFSKYSFPVLIVGEKGTGKETIAFTIHAESQTGTYPFVTADCSCVSPKAWESFLDHTDSPFYFSSYCIFFKHAESLNEDLQKKLIFYLEQTAAHKRCRLLFSWCTDSRADYRTSTLARFLLDQLDAVTLCIPSLNERREDIPSLASIHINNLNLQLGKQIIGLEGSALSLLKAFSWEGNLYQFSQVMNEMILLTDTPYISLYTARTVLDRQSVTHSSSTETVNLKQDLEHIISDVIRTVLNEEDQNQSRAAKRLGISRSTLWRKLKETE